MASPFTQGGSRHSEDDDNKFFSNALRQLEAINTPAALGITADLKTLQDDREGKLPITHIWWIQAYATLSCQVAWQ